MGNINVTLRRRFVESFTPLDLNPTVWLEGKDYAYTNDAGTILVSAPNQNIALMKNRGTLLNSGNGFQSSPSLRPFVEQVNPLIIKYVSPNFFNLLNTTNISTNTACTLWARYKIDSSVVGNNAIGCPVTDLIGTSSFDVLFGHLITGGYPAGIYFILGGSASPGSTQTGVYVPKVLDTNWRTVIITRTPGMTPNASNPSEYSCWLNGVSQTVIASPALGNQGSNLIGRQNNGNQFYGTMASIGRINYAIDNTQAIKLNNYLNLLV